MTNFHLKLLAIICMTIDHIGAVMFPQLLFLRIIGRLAFPIFVFLMVEGVYHTSNMKKYLLRLGVFAFISEIPFDLAFSGKLIRLDNWNVFFTLFAGVLAIYYIQRIKSGFTLWILLTFILWSVNFLGTDYGANGVLLMIALYYLRGNFKGVCLAFVLIFIFVMSGLQMYAVLAIVPIYFYNGEKGYNTKQLFYYYYPIHLIVLFIMKLFFVS